MVVGDSRTWHKSLASDRQVDIDAHCATGTGTSESDRPPTCGFQRLIAIRSSLVSRAARARGVLDPELLGRSWPWLLLLLVRDRLRLEGRGDTSAPPAEHEHERPWPQRLLPRHVRLAQRVEYVMNSEVLFYRDARDQGYPGRSIYYGYEYGASFSCLTNQYAPFIVMLILLSDFQVPGAQTYSILRPEIPSTPPVVVRPHLSSSPAMRRAAKKGPGI